MPILDRLLIPALASHMAVQRGTTGEGTALLRSCEGNKQ